MGQSQAERAEVEAVLRSGIFHRAPKVASFFRYVCDRYFEGEADKVKEYNIALEALGRPATFDQKKDSIVRVEAHRLRKLLSDYYAVAGANHALQITIPPGQYVPRFQVKGSDNEVESQAKSTQAPPAVSVEPAITLSDPRMMPPSRSLAKLAPGHSGHLRSLVSKPSTLYATAGSMEGIMGTTRRRSAVLGWLARTSFL